MPQCHSPWLVRLPIGRNQLVMSLQVRATVARMVRLVPLDRATPRRRKSIVAAVDTRGPPAVPLFLPACLCSCIRLGPVRASPRLRQPIVAKRVLRGRWDDIGCYGALVPGIMPGKSRKTATSKGFCRRRSLSVPQKRHETGRSLRPPLPMLAWGGLAGPIAPPASLPPPPRYPGSHEPGAQSHDPGTPVARSWRQFAGRQAGIQPSLTNRGP